MSSSFEISELESIAKPFKGILLDAFGVFWGGGGVGLLPGAKEAMELLIESGKIVGVLSNSTQLAQKEIEKVGAHGLLQGKHFHFYMTSGELAKEMFSLGDLPFPSSKKKFWLLGEEHPKFASHRALFEKSGYEETKEIKEADFIYLSIPHIKGEDQVNPQVFQKLLRDIRGSGLPLMCANPDRFAHEGHPSKAVVRQGSLAAMFEEMGGEVFYVGKPYPLAYQAAMKKFALYHVLQPEEVLMIGDTPEIDIRGARKAGMASALVIQTGIMADRVLQHGLENIVQTFSLEDCPDFFIERFSNHGFYTSP